MSLGPPPSVEERLDRLADELAQVTNELRRQRESRERWAELLDDLAPLAEQAMSVTISHLDIDSSDVENLIKLAHSLARNASVLGAWIGPLRSMSALADELAPLATPAVASLNSRLQQLDERGYFAFARRSVDVLDNVVTSFSEEDVRLLGENIVLILQTVKQMTQPEVMGMLRRTALTMQQADPQSGAPSMRGLLGQLRDPLVRRGLSRTLVALRSVGAQPDPRPAPDPVSTPEGPPRGSPSAHEPFGSTS